MQQRRWKPRWAGERAFDLHHFRLLLLLLLISGGLIRKHLRGGWADLSTLQTTASKTRKRGRWDESAAERNGGKKRRTERETDKSVGGPKPIKNLSVNEGIRQHQKSISVKPDASTHQSFPPYFFPIPFHPSLLPSVYLPPCTCPLGGCT